MTDNNNTQPHQPRPVKRIELGTAHNIGVGGSCSTRPKSHFLTYRRKFTASNALPWQALHLPTDSGSYPMHGPSQAPWNVSPARCEA